MSKLKYTNEDLRLIAFKYPTRVSFQRGDKTKYNIAFSRGILDEICAHMIPVNKSGSNNPRFVWTFEKIKKVADMYTVRSKFRTMDPKAYQAAQRNGWLDKVCSHMVDMLSYHTMESIKEKSILCKYRSEFERKFPKEYQIATKRGILNDICSHMGNHPSTSEPEIELFNLIKLKCPAAKKLIDKKVKISGKPHIYRLHIDIFIEEFNLGIEFDGKYHHSIKGLSRGRPKWPLEDIINYHQIKDGWFLSKGIKIFHIKEEEWIKNKVECIQKCFEFLGIKPSESPEIQL